MVIAVRRIVSEMKPLFATGLIMLAPYEAARANSHIAYKEIPSI